MKTTIRFITPVLCLSAAAIAPLTAQIHHPQSSTASAIAATQPILGVATERVSDEIRHQLPHLKPGAGLIVRMVMPDSPAAKAGVENLDILLHWNHQILVHPAQLQILVSSAKPGDQATLEFLHRGVVTRTQITLAQRSELQHRKQGHHPAAPHAGIRHPQLSPELIRQAAETFSQSGIDPNTIGQALKGLNLENIDLNAIGQALKGLNLENIDPNAIGQTLKGLNLENIDPNAIGQALKGLNLEKIDPNAIGQTLKGLNLEKIDPEMVELALKSIDLNAIAKALRGDQAAKPVAPKPVAPSKIILIAPDGTRTEIPLDKAMQPGGHPADVLKGLDLSKLDPATILNGKILLVQPDGTEQQINPGDLLKNSGAIDQLLKGFGQGPH